MRSDQLVTLDLHVPKEETSSLIPLNADVERDLQAIVGFDITTVEQLKEIVKTGFIPKIVGAILLLAIIQEASDIHIQADEEHVLVRYRVDGILADILLIPIALQAPIISRIKILAKMKIDEQRIPQDGRFDVLAGDHDVDLRVSTFPTVRGEKVVMRLLDKSLALQKLEDLGVMGSRLELLRAQIHKPYGVVLATGPTGQVNRQLCMPSCKRFQAPLSMLSPRNPVECPV